MATGPGDDAAVLADGLCVSVDTLVQGVHFDARLSWEDVGYKAVAVSVSDMAAMAARPLWMLLALSVPRDFDAVDALAEGVRQACEQFGVALVGGDTTRAGDRVVLSTTVAGRADTPVLRSGARPGDDLWVSGTPGLAGAGWRREEPPASALSALRRPQPPVDLAHHLGRVGVPSAMMDLSDGLAADLPRLARASGVSADVRAAALPVHPDLAGDDTVDLALRSGDDYQLLFAAAPSHRDTILRLGAEHCVSVYRIGQLATGSGCTLDGGSWPTAAFQHFGTAT